MADVVYAKDISGDFDLDSKGFLKIKTNEQAINDQIKLIFTTFRGDVLFAPSKGNSLEEELWEFEDDQLSLNSTLSDILQRNIPYINPTVSISIDPNDPRQVNYDVSYSITNDPNIGQIYNTNGTL
jgi:hypothetical protein